MSIIVKINLKYNQFGESDQNHETDYKAPDQTLDGLNTDSAGELGNVNTREQELETFQNKSFWEKFNHLNPYLKYTFIAFVFAGFIEVTGIKDNVRKVLFPNKPVLTKDIKEVSKDINEKHLGFMDKNQIEAVKAVQNQLYADKILFFFSSGNAIPGKIEYEIESSSTLGDLKESLSNLKNPKIKRITVTNSDEGGLFIITILY
jgi:hypothetical protein